MNYVGNLVWVKQDRKFPLTLRSGPGYTFDVIEPLEPGLIGIVTNQAYGHGATHWISILTASGNRGWVPITVMNILDQQSIL